MPRKVKKDIRAGYFQMSRNSPKWKPKGKFWSDGTVYKNFRLRNNMASLRNSE